MSFLGRAFKDRLGSAAIDMALILPIMIVMFLGVYEVSQAIFMYMRVIDTADTISDLTAQYRSVATSDLNNFYTAGQLVMSPSPGSGLGLALASVTFDPTTGNASVAWQVTRGGASAMTDAASAAVGLGSKGDSVIEATASYTYTSLFTFVLPHGIRMSSRVFSRPRNVSVIPCTAPCN